MAEKNYYRWFNIVNKVLTVEMSNGKEYTGGVKFIFDNVIGICLPDKDSGICEKTKRVILLKMDHVISFYIGDAPDEEEFNPEEAASRKKRTRGWEEFD